MKCSGNQCAADSVKGFFHVQRDLDATPKPLLGIILAVFCAQRSYLSTVG